VLRKEGRNKGRRKEIIIITTTTTTTTIIRISTSFKNFV
jgi:hypothetical protein